MNHTTLTFPRTSRRSGTEYANSIESTRRKDKSGAAIVLVLLAMVAIYYAIAGGLL